MIDPNTFVLASLCKYQCAMTVLKSMVINPFILDHYRFCTVDKEISIDKAAVDLKDNSGKRNK